MKWKNIVSIDKSFLPVCDIKSDDGSYWKNFICHDDFYQLMKNTLNMYQKREKSIWLQGAFGSGKTHATTVIKNLLSDDISIIDDYIEQSIKDVQVKSALINFREKYRTFPVILKSSYNIEDGKTFNYAIQQEVVNALKNANINEPIQNSYDDMIDRIEKNKTFWNEIINNSKLIDEVSNVDELIGEIKKHNDSILRTCEDELISRGLGIITNDIIKFLEDVASIVKKYGYSHITLFWDEFTPILQIDRYDDIFMSLQNLSENIKNGNVFLFIVAHRTPNPNRVLQEDIKKIQDRFELTHYEMKDVTTYLLLAHSIYKNSKYKEILQQYKNNNIFRETIKYVLYLEEGRNISNIENMLPIHPYCGLVLSLIARHFESSNRTIFQFLHAEDGFLSFLDKDVDYLMDISYLWDYFLPEFKENEELDVYINRFETSKYIEEINKDYLPILKAIVLLNVLNKIVGYDELNFHKILKPNKENLKYIFNLTKYSDILDDALEVIGSKYIQPDADGLYIISSAILPENEIFKQKRDLKDNMYKSVISVLKPKDSEIKKEFINGILREQEIYFSEATIKKYDIERYIDKKFKYDYTLHLMIFFAKYESELLGIKKLLNDIAPKNKDTIFVVVENPFGEERYLKFIDYKARERVAESHNFESEAERNRQQAEKLVEKYINSNFRNGSVTIYFGNYIRNGITIKNFSNEINSIAKNIFYYGPDNGLVDRYKLWNKQKPTNTIPNKIITYNRDELPNKLKGQYAPLVNLLKDDSQNYVLDEKYQIKDEYSNHFLVKMIQEVDLVISKEKKHTINLERDLKFLTKPPYGLYSNPISFAILSFIMKRYDGKFYAIGNDRKIEKSLLVDYIVNIFKFFNDNRIKEDLRVRFGTKEEDRLREILKDIFLINEDLGIKEYTFKIKNWIRSANYPLWVVKYAENTNEIIKDFIDKLNKLINVHGEEIQLKDIKELVNLVEKNNILSDIKMLIQKDSFQNYFNNFIKSLKLDIDPKNYDKIYDYIKSKIRANYDSDISGWDENSVIRLILEWKRDFSKTESTVDSKPAINLNSNENNNNNDDKIVTIDEPNESEIEEFKNKIKYLNLSLIVLEHIDEDKELYRVLKKYVMD